MCACPDHWHALTSLSALTQGKDVFGEKPISHKFVEGRAMADAQKKHGRIWQTGSWQRSVFNFRYGVELVHNGHIGKVKRVEIGLPSGHADFGRTGNNSPNGDPPAHLDYDFWIGPAQMEPYNRSRSHKNWRWNYNIGGGQLMDWIGHHCDIAHWGLSDTEYGIGPEAQLGPLTVAGSGEFPPKEAVWNTATKYRIECKYPNDVEVVIAGGHGDIRGGTKWIGEDGKWVYVNRGKFEASEKQWTKRKFDRGPKKAYLSDNHWRNFLDCIKSRKPSITPAEVAHRSATPGHLGLIAMITGRKLTWDPKTETIANDAGATALLRRDLRKPWRLDQFS
ncbi:MAG: gfo/Idh/MocA family oxidoreductase, partial [Phycisphaerae bacterium]|nr:gfo/Idh/MocA family oxidoreductase [Phycisphaerae bacterium]